MKCAAITRAGFPCSKGIKTGCSVHVDDYVYYLCGGTGHKPGQHLFGLNEERRTKVNKVAVLGDTHIDLRTGTEYTQLKLDNPSITEEKEDTVIYNGEKQVHVYMVAANAFIKLEGDGTKFFFWKDAIVTIDQANLARIIHRHLNDDSNKSKFALVRVDGKIFGFKADGSFTQLTNVVITKNRYSNTPTVTDITPIEKKGSVCGKCSKWVNGKKVDVFHANSEAVKLCYQGNEVPVVS